MNFPNREELLFLTVCALPKASRMGFALNICCDKADNCFDPERGAERTYGVSEVATAARYWMTFLVFSVLPAPDSPLFPCQLGLKLDESSGDLRHENTLVLAFLNHVSKRLVRHGEYMRSRFLLASSLVHLHIFAAVNRQWAVRINCYQEQSRICLDKYVNARSLKPIEFPWCVLT